MRLPGALAVGALAVLLGGCGSSDGGDAAGPATTGAPAGTPASAEVVIDTFQYGPDPLTVSAGTTVRFTNEDPTTHTVTAGTREQPRTDQFDASLGDGASASWTLAEPGTYDYFCTIHKGEGMTGRIVVEG